jgi:hypothetical protein
MWEQSTHPFAALAVLMELPTWFDNASLVLMTAAAEGFDIDRLAVHADHGGLVIERVDVARPAVHEEEDDALGLCRQRRGLGRERTGRRRG